jgi:hypothetical protein
MHVTPYIRDIKLEGGSFYTFGSAAEDLTFAMNNEKKKFKFSKFALLKIPDIGRPSNYRNALQLNSPPGAWDAYGGDPTIGGNMNEAFAESLQNYCLNLETLITARDDYDAALDKSVTERVFFKWLKEIGGIRFINATNEEFTGLSGETKFIEEKENTVTGLDYYDRVVQYIGEINVTNALRNKYNAYQEVYIHVPTSHGNTPDILFKTVEDTNYYAGLKITNEPTDTLNDEVLYGRSWDDVHPTGLDIHAHYDSEGGFTDFWTSEDGTSWIDSSDVDFDWWYTSAKDATHFLEPTTFSNSANNYLGHGDDPGDDGVNYIKFKRSKLDGISIEWDTSKYAKIENNDGLNNFGEFNGSQYTQNFEFNAILVYYDVYDPNRLEDKATNLFGVLFLDNVDPISTGGGKIESLPKIKPDELNQSNGNSYAFKLNMKWDLSADDSEVEVSINDYNTYSLELYVDAMNSMQTLTDSITYHFTQYDTVLEEINKLKDVVYTSDNLDVISTKLTAIENTIEDAYDVYLNNTELTKLVNKNYDEISNIYKNYTSIEMTYNLNSIQNGNGIKLDRNTKNKLLISNSNFGYDLGKAPLIYLSDFDDVANTYEYNFKMTYFDNFLRIMDGTADELKDADKNIVIRLNDATNKWETGKKMRISFEYGLDLNNTSGDFKLYVFTDSTDKVNSGFFYSKEVTIVNSQMFETKNGKPIIEITCIDPDEFIFVTDIL